MEHFMLKRNKTYIFIYIKKMAVKEVKKSTYVWTHVGVIIFHVLIGALLVASRYSSHLLGLQSKNLVPVLGLILIVVSLLGLFPILKNHDKMVIE
jgi:hypothetical protein